MCSGRCLKIEEHKTLLETRIVIKTAVNSQHDSFSKSCAVFYNTFKMYKNCYLLEFCFQTIHISKIPIEL